MCLLRVFFIRIVVVDLPTPCLAWFSEYMVLRLSWEAEGRRVDCSNTAVFCLAAATNGFRTAEGITVGAVPDTQAAVGAGGGSFPVPDAVVVSPVETLTLDSILVLNTFRWR